MLAREDGDGARQIEPVQPSARYIQHDPVHSDLCRWAGGGPSPAIVVPRFYAIRRGCLLVPEVCLLTKEEL
ncbi:hypothetical protein BAUCODRAFT_36629 [Baudoinia panamericana UAMH 10762]|uniref:Uncharacterized protein n=1 Tax=Baudoinia panamericana (strain UAMH 10762) TaxID=717646 RepID=M2N544_BAUPA|nr:uncharacterized protein BAUCODRAFT_36629 [Baudoinia panamericana UAMH 10762]EMC94154.1 hypothetical protein BAUCODRAFT_36629 [Baudoinia panamericana UAMH 10762]